jgi:flagellar basal-body rod protein FlgG
VAEPFPEVMVQNKDKVVLGKNVKQNLGEMSFGVSGGEIYTDFTQGATQDTGRELDFALNGRGFFAVSFPDDAENPVKYTRDGSFSVDRDGIIVNADGGYLLARNIETGALEPIATGGGKVSVSSGGVVSIDSEERYAISVVDFQDYNAVNKAGKNMYTANSIEPVQLGEGQYQVNQGKLEGSNIDISTEMVNMITNLRAFQANQRVIQSIDETLAKTVNEVGALK